MSGMAALGSALPAIVIASGDGEGGAALFGLVAFAVPFVVGWATYRALYRRYRNQDKRYLFEHTTSATRSNLQRWDTFVRERKRMRNSRIEGRNDNEPLKRAQSSQVREAMGPRIAQEERLAQEARMAQEPRTAAEPRDAQVARAAEAEREAQQPRAAHEPPETSPPATPPPPATQDGGRPEGQPPSS